eukprot:1322353-Amorphochlora_amoeboformis.AAC.1
MFENLHQNLRELCTEASKNGQQGLPLTKVSDLEAEIEKERNAKKETEIQKDRDWGLRKKESED